MRVVAQYSFAGGHDFVAGRHTKELEEVIRAIESVDAMACFTKKSKEATKAGRMLYAPKVINSCILEGFLYKVPYNWNSDDQRLRFTYDIPDLGKKTVTLTVDGIKNKVALEIQLGKYCFNEYDICAKLPIFKRFGRIECGIEVIPMNSFTRNMSTGPGWFERTATILENRGFSDLDVPMLLLGIDA